MDFTKVIVMLARQRSGTNPLRDVLGKHEDVCCLPEVFDNRPSPYLPLAEDVSYFRFVEQRIRGGVASALSLDDQEQVFLDFLRYLRCFTDKTYLLLDVKYNSTHHLNGAWRFITEEPALFGLIKRHGLRVLNLTRRNYLRYYLSEVKAQTSGTWHTYDPSVVGEKKWYVERYGETGKRPALERDRKVVLDSEEMLETLTLCRSESEFVDRSFAGYQPHLTLEYADLFRRVGAPPDDAELARLARWLNIPDAFPVTRSQYRKQAVLPLQETIENYGEVVEALSGTPFEYCLQDEPMYRGAPVQPD